MKMLFGVQGEMLRYYCSVTVAVHWAVEGDEYIALM